MLVLEHAGQSLLIIIYFSPKTWCSLIYWLLRLLIKYRVSMVELVRRSPRKDTRTLIFFAINSLQCFKDVTYIWLCIWHLSVDVYLLRINLVRTYILLHDIYDICTYFIPIKIWFKIIGNVYSEIQRANETSYKF